MPKCKRGAVLCSAVSILIVLSFLVIYIKPTTIETPEISRKGIPKSLPLVTPQNLILTASTFTGTKVATVVVFFLIIVTAIILLLFILNIPQKLNKIAQESVDVQENRESEQSGVLPFEVVLIIGSIVIGLIIFSVLMVFKRPNGELRTLPPPYLQGFQPSSVSSPITPTTPPLIEPPSSDPSTPISKSANPIVWLSENVPLPENVLRDPFEYDFKQKKCIGGGKNGIVFEASDSANNCIIAVKQYSHDPKFCEARLTRLFSLSDPNRFVNYITHYTHGKKSFLVMERMKGEDLSRMHEKLSKQSVSVIIREILKALQVMHNLGWCHNDIRPGNVFITDDGKVKLLDFGMTYVSSFQNDYQALADLLQFLTADRDDPQYIEFYNVLDSCTDQNSANIILDHPYITSFNHIGVEIQ